MTLITCRDLSLSYGQKPVVEGLSFSVNASDRLCVLGENGTGKSTLLRALAGLHTPSSGEIVWGEGVRTGIGYLPQRAAGEGNFPATVKEVAQSGVRRTGLFLSREDRVRIEEMLETFGVSDLKGERIGTLSGGQRQRVLLARAALAASRLLLLDEPVTGLDPLITHELYHLIRALSRTGIGIAAVSHDIAGALTFFTHILYLGEKKNFFGTVEEFKETEFCRGFAEEEASRV